MPSLLENRNVGWFSKRRGGRAQEDTKPTVKNVRYVWSRNMQLHVAAPVGPDWQLMEAGPGAGGLLAAIRCLHGEPPDALALNAYAYQLPAEQQRTVEQLCQQDWQARWKRTAFSTIQSATAQVVERPGVEPACEVVIEGRGGSPEGPLRVQEQHVPSGRRLLVVSVAGPPDLFRALQPVVQQWLVHAALGS